MGSWGVGLTWFDYKPKIVLHFIPTGGCSIEHNIHNFIIFENFLYVKWCKMPVKFLRFPLENLGVAPVLRRSSSQTLYLYVGVKRGVSSTLRCDLQMENRMENSYQAQYIYRQFSLLTLVVNTNTIC